MRRVVISGLGIVAPPGATTDAFWQACLRREAPVEHVPHEWLDYAPLKSRVWAPLPAVDFAAHGITRIDHMQIARSTILALCSVHQALAHAGLEVKTANERKQRYRIEGLEPSRTGVFGGTGVGGLSTLIATEANHVFSPLRSLLRQMSEAGEPGGQKETARRMAELMRMPPRFNPMVVPMIMPNAVSAMVGLRYGLTGENTTFACACAAGTVALGQGFRAVREGSLDCAIAGGAEYLRDDFGGIFRGFDSAGTLVQSTDSAEGANRPFDNRRSGFLFGEGGAAFMVLEEREHALRRGVRPLAEISGFAQTFDAHSIMALQPDGDQIRRMIRGALGDARLAPGDIDLINAHGTGTVPNDALEAQVIQEVFPHSPLVTATKSLTGHTFGAAGAIEAAVTALSIRDKTTHACHNLTDPVRELNFVTEVAVAPVSTALTHSFAFGGHNAGLVLTEAG